LVLLEEVALIVAIKVAAMLAWVKVAIKAVWGTAQARTAPVAVAGKNLLKQ